MSIINQFERKLWKVLEEYREKGECVVFFPEDTREVEYVYKQFPLYGGAVNGDGNYVTIHSLIPKEDFEIWEHDHAMEPDGTPIILSTDKKRLFFACKEVREASFVKERREG
jgi:hypothetical protein